MNEFFTKLQSSVQEEQEDHDKYVKLANEAPTEKIKKILTDIAHEEEIHKQFIIEILKEASGIEY